MGTTKPEPIQLHPRPVLTALRADRIFDGTTDVLIPDQVVIIDGVRIANVIPAAGLPDGIEVVDLPGTTLLPGLIDTHVHMFFDATDEPVAHLATLSDAEALQAAREWGHRALRGGVTTVRDLGDLNYLSLQLRADEGDLPTVVAAGPPVTTPVGHCHFLGGGVEPTERDVRRAVREHAERGVDVIKLMASGGNMTPGSRQELSQFPTDVLRAAVDEAHRCGLPITAHAHGTAAVRDAIAAGCDGIEHASFWSAEGVDDPAESVGELAVRGIVVGCTLGIVPVEGGGPPPEAVLRRMPMMLANVRRMHDAGVRIAAGTDAGIAPVKPPEVVRYAVGQLRDVGMSSAAALRTATSVAAAVVGLGGRKGRLMPGFDADLLAVDGDPLIDPGALHRVRAVYRSGRPVSLAP